jgi:hypothetical protein
MGWTNYALTALLVVIQGVVGLFGSYFGYTVDGVPMAGYVSGESPGIFGVVEFIWESIEFYFNMLTFQVDDMPIFIGMIFIIMGIMTVVLIINLIRGGS